MPTLIGLGLPGDEKDWAALGFAVENRTMRIGAVSCLVGTAPAWGFDELPGDASALGIPELLSDNLSGSGTHPNGATFVDHIVYLVNDMDDAVAALADALGTPPRRRFHPRGPSGPEMAFYRVGEAFIEVVAGGRPPELIGVAFGTPDLDATVAAVREAGGPISDPKPAVQGGRIASVWNGHIGWGIAFMEPKPQ
ncbi:catechol 2,3-dioxygenase-like lactoylglutathione lyase family enzyme [Nocardia transvalensis]|uniref:Catechol 2,3-dioxygenase-like lactoylglutathione lyase family enzyme n=1 Tax=Nocardia transvalensis TaxID=37333 RepID=A0A7W9UNJ4_9NOCA|nr:VOC family protein [Nocardia transvalensis]MBB5918900.1 catechol 2,3-dioxygenase-like lactoylglutathione lyase family enzyme [Nocardia transvalensis]